MNMKLVPIEGNCRYYATEEGEIYSLRKDGFKKMHRTLHGGYPTVCLHLNGKQTNKFVHILVYMAFKGEIPKGYQIDHIDCNKFNASIDNLEAVTPSENQKRASANGLRDATKRRALDKSSKFQIEAAKKRAELNALKAKRVYCFETMKTYPTTLSASTETGVSRASMVRVCNGFLESTKGLTFKWAE